ncbi:hypothetical protein [Bacteroides sp.]|uniref:DUF7833 domain-containing protein n=1 Tax=Bacteroides sp. TaxID=29523 RepID=UPI00263821BE|nr:hypothetical protein [Bacteroides sp.]
MKTIFYLQHSLMAMSDPRMQNLLEKEGLRGIGAYWYILEKLSMVPGERAQIEYLHPFSKGKKVPFAYLKKIILHYLLFSMDEEGFITPEALNPMPKKKPKKDKESADSKSKNDKNRQKASLNKAKTKQEKSGNKLKDGTLAKSDIDNTKENIKDIITTATTEEKEETAAAAVTSSESSDGNKFSDGNELQPTVPQETTLNICDDFGRPQRPLHSVRPWQELADELLNENSVWLEIAFMRSGYGTLLKRHLKAAIEIFKSHIIAYGKGDDMLEMRDIQSYFINYVNAGSRTSKSLHEALTALDAKGSPNNQGNADEPYRFEQFIDGKRTYQGCPIPYDAPPRPDETAFWDEEQHAWITGRKAKK